jgi:hypothetical protein
MSAISAPVSTSRPLPAGSTNEFAVSESSVTVLIPLSKACEDASAFDGRELRLGCAAPRLNGLALRRLLPSLYSSPLLLGVPLGVPPRRSGDMRCRSPSLHVHRNH